jgi:hypothetical protein
VRVIRIATVTLAVALLISGAIALVGLARGSDTEFVGRLLMLPAILFGLIRVPPGVLFRVSEGWPVLTWAGVTVAYLLPAVALLLAARRHRNPSSAYGK